jgi:hypothetical protein
MKMKSTIKLFSMAVFTSMLLFGCYPNEDIYYSDTDIAVTRFDDTYDFGDAEICVLFDTVMHVVEEGEDAKEGMNDAHMLKEIEKNLKENTKFTVYVTKDSLDLKAKLEADEKTLSDVDLVVTTTVMETDYYYTGYYPWYGYWYWGWGWYKSGSLKTAKNTEYYYYPWYPWGGGTYYAYTTGTIMIDMIDAKSIDDSHDEVRLPVVWNGVINGLLSGNKTDQANRITTQVNKCFKQSPYLK